MMRSISTASKLTTALAAAVICLTPAIALAELKIGVVDLDTVIRNSPQFETMNQTLQNEFGPRQRDLAQKEKDFKARVEKFQKDSATMTDADKGKMERELRETQRDLERKGNEFKDDANARQNEEIQKLQRAVASDVQAYAKFQNFDLVIFQGVLYAKEGLDITTQVVSAIQAKSGKAAPATTPSAPAKK